MILPQLCLRLWSVFSAETDGFNLLLNNQYWKLSSVSGLDSSFTGLDSQDTVGLTAPQEIATVIEGREITFTFQVEPGKEQDAWEFASRWFVAKTPAWLFSTAHASVYMPGYIASFSYDRFTQNGQMEVTFIPQDNFWHGADSAYTYEISQGGTVTEPEPTVFVSPSDFPSYPKISLDGFQGGSSTDSYFTDLYVVLEQEAYGDLPYFEDVQKSVTRSALHLSGLDKLDAKIPGQGFVGPLVIDAAKGSVVLTYPTAPYAEEKITVDLAPYIDYSPISIRLNPSLPVLEYPQWDMTLQPGSGKIYLYGFISTMFVDSAYDYINSTIAVRPLWATWPRDLKANDGIVIDPNIIPDNIKSGITILGVEGTYTGGATEEYPGPYEVTPDTEAQTLPTSGKAMTDDVTVNAITPINPDSGLSIFNKGTDIMTVAPDASITTKDQKVQLTVSVDRTGWYERPLGGQNIEYRVGIDTEEAAKIIPGNIRSGVTVLGVQGSYDGGGTGESYPGPYEVTPSTEEQTLETSGKTMDDNVTVKAITPVDIQDGIKTGNISFDIPDASAHYDIDNRDQVNVIAPVLEKEGWYTSAFNRTLTEDNCMAVGIASREKAKIIPENIRAGVSILGIEGSYDGGSTGESYPGPYEVTPSTEEQTLETDGKTMTNNVTVHAISPVNPDNGLSIMETGTDIMATAPDSVIAQKDQKVQLTVSVDKAGWYDRPLGGQSIEYRVGLDANEAAKLVPDNIVDGVTVLGVQGAAEKSLPDFEGGYTIEVTALSEQLDTAGTTMRDNLTIQVDEPNLVPGNVRAGVSILGVEGTLESGRQSALKLLCDKTGTLCYILNPSPGIFAWTTEELAQFFVDPDVTSGITDMRRLNAYSPTDSSPSTKLDDVTVFPPINITGLNDTNAIEYAFWNCDSLEEVQIDWSTLPEIVTDGSYIFYHTAIKTLPTVLISKLKSMDYAFMYCTALALPDGTIALPNVTYCPFMFQRAFSSTGDVVLKGIDAQLLTSAQEMFAYSNLTEISGTISMPQANTRSLSGITTDFGLFSNCNRLTSVNATIDAETLAYAFQRCDALTTATVELGPHVTNASYLFRTCNALINASVTGGEALGNADYAFYYCGALASIPAFPFANVTSADYMFASAFDETKNVVLGDINAPLLTSAYEMFMQSNITGISGNISMPQAQTRSSSGTTSQLGLFNNCDALTTVNATIDAAVLSYAFQRCAALATVNLELGAHVTNASYLFWYCSALTSASITGGEALELASYTFASCSALTSMPVFPFSAPNLSSVQGMFNYAFDATANVVVGDISAPTVTAADDMFASSHIVGVSGTISMPLADTCSSSSSSSAGFFNGCEELVTVSATLDANGLQQAFRNCSALTTLNLMLGEHVTTIYRLCYSCSALTSVSDLDLSNITNHQDLFYGCSSLTTFTDSDAAPEGRRWQFQARSGGVNFSSCPLDRASILKVFNGLVEATTGTTSSYRTIRLSATTRGYLSDDDIAIATAKNWIVS